MHCLGVVLKGPHEGSLSFDVRYLYRMKPSLSVRMSSGKTLSLKSLMDIVGKRIRWKQSPKVSLIDVGVTCP